jgi:hypothetical protein
VLLLHVEVQLRGGRRRRRRPGVFHGLRPRAEERVGITAVLGRMGAERSSSRCRGGRAPRGGCRCGPRLAAPCSTCSICAAGGHDVPCSPSIRRGGSRAERHLKGRRRGDGVQEQERTGEDRRR